MSVLIPTFFGGYFLLMFSRASSARKKIIVRVFLVIILFFIFETMLLTKKGKTVRSSYYYGTLFPVFWVILVALILPSRKKRYQPIGLVIFIFLLLLSGYNFIVLGRSWYLDHGRPIGVLYPHTARMENDGIDLTRQMVMDIWKNRDQPGVLEELRKNYPRRSYWFFAEMEYSWLFRTIDRLEKEVGTAQPIQAADQIIPDQKPGNLLSARDVCLRVSDQNGPGLGAENLIDDNYDTIWHILVLEDFVTRPSWLEVDLGREGAVRVRTVAALPAPHNPQAFLKRGLLLGSRDRLNWEPVSLLEGPRNPNLNEWIYWNITPDRSYRFYKLYLVNNPDNSRDYFLALSELGFYE
ncbi:MAG: discoidin domain-containing protein [PVC group bacterium]